MEKKICTIVVWIHADGGLCLLLEGMHVNGIFLKNVKGRKGFTNCDSSVQKGQTKLLPINSAVVDEPGKDGTLFPMWMVSDKAIDIADK